MYKKWFKHVIKRGLLCAVVSIPSGLDDLESKIGESDVRKYTKALKANLFLHSTLCP